MRSLAPLRSTLFSSLLLLAAAAIGACTFDGSALDRSDGQIADQAADAPDLGVDAPAKEQGLDLSIDVAGDGLEAGTDGSQDGIGDVGPDLGVDLPQPNCSDGKKNGGETDIDCGGPNCSACAIGKTCTKTSDCSNPNLCSTKVCAQPQSCAALHIARPTVPTANYAIKPSASDPAITTRCDMDTDGGGWTLIMRTVWDWNDSQKLMTGFSAFYNTPAGAISGAFRLPGKYWVALGAQKQLLLSAAPRTKAGGSCGPLRYSETGTTLSANTGSKELRFDGLVTLLRRPELTTSDSGPDQPCIAADGVPWFYKNCCVICPTLGSVYWSPARPMMTVAQLLSPDLQGNTLTDVCSLIETSANFAGIDTMEWYLR